MADDDMYLENLKEFVNDEEKIVTYKWLSRTLSVNVNQAKQMLYAFVQHQQKDKNNCLSIVYIVGGIIKADNGSMVQKYLFALEKDLEDIKQCYVKLTSLHIYSVQKTNPKDSNVLYMADYDLQKENLDSPNRWSSITCKFAAKHITEKQDTRDTNNREKEEREKSMSNGFHKKPNQDTQGQLKPVASTSTKTTKSKAKPSKKKGDVASFFARQAASNKKETQKVENPNNRNDEPSIKEKLSEKEKEIEQNNDDATSDDKIINKEEKETEATEKDDKNKDIGSKISNDEEKIETISNDSEESVKTKTLNRKESSSSKKKSSPSRGEKKTEKTQKEKKNDKEKLEKGVKRNKTKNFPKEKKDEHDDGNSRKRKKRKRVIEFCDSSEEEVESPALLQSGSSGDTTPIPDQQPQEPVNKTEPQKVRRRKKVLKSKTDLNDEGYMVESPVITQSGSSGDTTPIPDQQPQEPVNKTEPQKVRRRKRVLKSKTYLNDEGYMVTEKVYESESTDGSDNEKEARIPEKVDEKKPAVKKTKPSPKKKPVKIATKQASLTSFFKRS